MSKDKLRKDALEYHQFPKPGKIATQLTKPTETQYDLALAYSPGVAEPVLEIEKDPENDRLYFRLGVVYDKAGRKDDSIEAMKTAVRLDPQNASALNYLGYTYADQGKNLDEAERLVKEALKYKPDDGYITDSLGWVYYKKGNYLEAIKYLHRAVELASDDPTILEHLGDAYLKANQPAKALEYYRQSLKKRKKDKGQIRGKIRELSDKPRS